MGTITEILNRTATFDGVVNIFLVLGAISALAAWAISSRHG